MYRRISVVACVATIFAVTILAGCGSSSTSTNSSSATTKPRRGTVFAIVCEMTPGCAKAPDPKAGVTIDGSPRLFSSGTVAMYFTYWCDTGDIVKGYMSQAVYSDSPYYYTNYRVISDEPQMSAKCYGKDHPIVDQAFLVKPTVGSFGPSGGDPTVMDPFAYIYIYSGSQTVWGGGVSVTLSCTYPNQCPKYSPGAPVPTSTTSG
jgi:hypothetical protein